MRTAIATGAAALIIAAFQATSGHAGDNTETAEAANKEKALYCADLIFNKHDLETARTECFGETYIQHNPMAEDGVDTIIDFLGAFYEENPEASADFKRAAADGDLVWIHYNAKFTPDSPGFAVVDIFRMEDGRLVEHWDVVQPVPAESKNDNTVF